MSASDLGAILQKEHEELNLRKRVEELEIDLKYYKVLLYKSELVCNNLKEKVRLHELASTVADEKQRLIDLQTKTDEILYLVRLQREETKRKNATMLV